MTNTYIKVTPVIVENQVQIELLVKSDANSNQAVMNRLSVAAASDLIVQLQSVLGRK